jgi:alkyl hydroperoxide reductase subunit AhpC
MGWLCCVLEQISSDYGVLIEEDGIALRGLFIISDKGIVRQITINDLPVGRNVEEVIRLVKAFRFVDEHGEVCPANWTPGAASVCTWLVQANHNTSATIPGIARRWTN